jgi:integrase
MTRRAHGEGSIYQRSDGLWVASARLGKQDGRPSRRVFYGRTRKEAAGKLQAALRDHAAGIRLTTRNDTLGRYLEEWLAATQGTIRPTTHRRYRQIVAHQLTPRLGTVPLGALRPGDVEAMLRDVAADLSPRSVHHVRAVLRTALTRAVRHGLVPRNAAALAAAPHVPRTEVRALSPEQVRRLMAALEDHPRRALFVLAIATGLRSGELRGLQWSDIDLEAGTLTVRRSLQRVDGAFRDLEPKTRGSRRTIALPPVAVDALRRHRLLQAESPLVSTYLFSTVDGLALHGATIWRELQAVLAAAGLPSMPVHALRHTAATLLLAQGVHPRVVMDMLGHSTIALTMNTYSHVLPELRREAADEMERLIGG